MKTKGTIGETVSKPARMKQKIVGGERIEENKGIKI